MEIGLLIFMISLAIVAGVFEIIDRIAEHRRQKAHEEYLERENQRLERVSNFYRLQRELGEQDVQM